MNSIVKKYLFNFDLINVIALATSSDLSERPTRYFHARITYVKIVLPQRNRYRNNLKIESECQ